MFYNNETAHLSAARPQYRGSNKGQLERASALCARIAFLEASIHKLSRRFLSAQAQQALHTVRTGLSGAFDQETQSHALGKSIADLRHTLATDMAELHHGNFNNSPEFILAA